MNTWLCVLASSVTWWAGADAYHDRRYGWLAFFVAAYLGVCTVYAELIRLSVMVNGD